MNLRQIQDIAGHRDVPPWVIKLVQDCIEHDRAYESAQPQDCIECGAKQAKIDSLMLEYCPDEITDEQMAEWAKYQTPVQECRHCGWLCKPNPNNQKFLEALRGIK